MSAPRILAIVAARGGSRRLPGKNLRLVAGKPLLQHTLEAALGARHLFADLVVSTDDPQIAEVARACGVRVPFRRPPELAVDGAPLAPVLRQATSFLEAQLGAPFDWICWLSPTFPLRRAEDIAAAVALANEGGCDSVIAVVPAAENLAVQLRRIEGERVQPFYRTADGSEPDPRAFPPAFRRAGGLVLVRRAVLMQAGGSLWGEVQRALVLPEERGLELRSEFDLERADALLAPPAPAATAAVRPAPPPVPARTPEKMLAVLLAPAGPARGPVGSLAPLAGKKRVSWAFEVAAACRKVFSKMVVATADHEVGQLARSLGLDVPFRLPPALAEASPAAILAHSLGLLEPRGGAAYEWICAIQAGFPLLTPADLQQAAALALEGRGDAVAAVVAAPELHPLFLKKIAGGRLLPYTVPEPEDLRPEDARPAAWLPSEAITLVRRAPLLERGTLRGAATLPLELSVWSALAADTPANLALADRLLRRRPAAGR